MSEARVSPRSRFFHGYYNGYCYLPLYVFCGRHLLAAKLRRSNIDACAGALEEVERLVGQIRARWPRVRILLRADSGFAREALMSWCERNRVDFVFGLARNSRLEAEIAAELARAEAQSRETGAAARLFKELRWTTRDSWSRKRRVVAPPRAPARVRFAGRIDRLLTVDGRMDARRTQPALHRHLAQGQRLRGSAPIRAGLLCPRRDGEPDQGVPARPVR